MEKVYNLVSLLFLYGLPLLVIIICYTIVSIRSIYQQKKAAAIRNKNQAALMSKTSQTNLSTTNYQVQQQQNHTQSATGDYP